MSWRSGSSLFIRIWPSIQKHLPERESRLQFTADLLKIFIEDDMDPHDIEDVHPDIRAAILLAGYEIQEPVLYEDDVDV